MEDEQIQSILIPMRAWQETVDHLQGCLPEEGCGLWGGQPAGPSARVSAVFPVENSLHSPVRYRMDPAAQLLVFQSLEQSGLELVAIFHSHPAGPQSPSTTDIVEFYYPGVVTLIFSQEPGRPGWTGRAFKIFENSFSEILVTMV